MSEPTEHNYFGFDDAKLARMRRIENFAAWIADRDLANLNSVDLHFALQTRMVDLSQIDYLGRLETFDDDFARICARIGVPVTRADVLNPTRLDGLNRRTASTQLTAMIAQMYRRDFQVFGYDDGAGAAAPGEAGGGRPGSWKDLLPAKTRRRLGRQRQAVTASHGRWLR